MDKTNEQIIGARWIKDFKCIAETCEDTCCAGWAILIDEETYRKYKKIKNHTLKVRLDREIVAKRSQTTQAHAAKIKLKNGKCAFLAQTGLCDIYSELGEKYLSQTCRLYPRTINRVNGKLECSLICSCPEAARRMLLSKEKMTFGALEMREEMPAVSADIETNRANPQWWQDYFVELRTLIMTLLQNRAYTIEERFMLLETFMNKLDQYCAPSLVKKIPQLIKCFIKDFQKDKVGRSVKIAEQVAGGYLDLACALKELKTKKKIKSKRYEACLDAMLIGLELDQENDLKRAQAAYELGYNKYYKDFLAKQSYMIENYFTNYVFERCMPVDQETPLLSFERMLLYYKLINVHLIGMANAYKGITQEDMIKLIQALSKTFDHDDESLATLLKSMQKK